MVYWRKNISNSNDMCQISVCVENVSNFKNFSSAESAATIGAAGTIPFIIKRIKFTSIFKKEDHIICHFYFLRLWRKIVVTKIFSINSPSEISGLIEV